MYDLIFNFIHDNFFNISNMSMLPAGFDVWLSHGFTIVSMSLLFFVCIKFIVWMFKLGAGLFFWN